MIDRPRPTLKLEDLGVEYRVRGEPRQILHGISFAIGRGETYGLVGESGCGKSTVAYAVLRYLPRNGVVNRGRILIDGQDLLGLDADRLRHLWRKSVAMVYQDPSKALNPSLRIGRQVEEVYELMGMSRSERPRRAAEMLTRVRISDPARVMQRYPHQLSGGMQQRVAIAMALASEPALLVLDEPTTGLDATVEAEVLDLIAELRREISTSILFISHNLAVIAKMCDRIGVLYAGRLVEQGRTEDIFRNPRHPYTVGLLRCLPQRGSNKEVAPLTTIPGFLPAAGVQVQGCVFASRCSIADERCRTIEPDFFDLGGRFSKCHYHERAADLPTVGAFPASKSIAPVADRPILHLDKVSKTFGSGAHGFRALDGVSLELRTGETLGLVGESGSGKTTLAWSILGLVRPDVGSRILLDGEPAASVLSGRTQAQVKSIQIVFQNPDAALNRSHSVRRMIGRTISKLTGLAKEARNRRIEELAHAVRLADLSLGAKPRQLSGGLKQRVAIARAFAADPRVVVCDEPTSALDVSVQAAILNLLVELQHSKQVSYVFISHDLGVVRYLSDRIAVLYLGRVMEVGPAEKVFSGPHHPYTEALLSSVPAIDGRHPTRVKLSGEIPSAVNPPSGCVFHTRCPRKLGAICAQSEPPLAEVAPGHALKCHIPIAELARLQGVPNSEPETACNEVRLRKR
jgi:peptide/nickel transport system ATP-binding protein